NMTEAERTTACHAPLRYWPRRKRNCLRWSEKFRTDLNRGGPHRRECMTQIAPVKQVRDTLLLSHANPEDNEFTLWLALQLAKEGYPVWCDLTQFLGGEDFWKDAEEAIRDRTAKLIFVLSKTSNRKDGPLKELRVAQNVAKKEKLNDFVLPCQIDDL